jgi:hypothetical protein
MRTRGREVGLWLAGIIVVAALGLWWMRRGAKSK